jgi:RNA-directed DNA polymerase
MGSFDNIDQELMVKFVEHRIGDRRVVRLIQRWLKAGILEEGKWVEVETGTPQGAVISPILANLYLHYVLDLWVDVWREKVANGDVIIVRYADDFVMGFQYKEDAEKFLEQLRERMRKFKLELHPVKTRLIEFGRFAQSDRKKRGQGKPETFNFLGFTHICGTTYKTGNFNVKRITIGKKMTAKLKEIRQKLRQRMHDGVPETLKWLQSVIRGYFQYHAIPGNWKRMQTFRNEVARSWCAQLRRRGQRRKYTWAKFWERLGSLLPKVKILHPYPTARFDARHPR